MITTDDGTTYDWPLESITPREVQLRALSKGFGKPGFAYFMRQRTGKTWTAYAEFSILRDQGKVKWMIIICPNSLKQQWLDNIEQVDMFTPVMVYESSTKNKVNHFLSRNKTGGVIIINYESVKTYVDAFGDAIDKSLCYIVADESTKIKEPTNKSTKACLLFAKGMAYKRVLTGRPTANTNLDIWAQLAFIDGTKRNFHQHKYTFCVMGGYQGRQVRKNINIPLLKSEIDPISYIAEDKYVVGFEKIYEPMRRVNLAGRLKELYDKMENDLVFAVNDELNITAPIVLVQYLRLQQIGSGIAGDTEGDQHNLIEPSQNPRIRVLKDIVENEITNKVIIVCKFKLSIQNVYHELTREGYKVAVLTGGMAPKEIENIKREFNEGDTNILVAQIQVLSFGHTLCATDENPCDSMIFYENDFSLTNRAQSESRPEKMGRNKPISYYDLYASEMDKYILQTLLKKEEASLALMNYAKQRGIRPEGISEIDLTDKPKTKLEIDYDFYEEEAFQ